MEVLHFVYLRKTLGASRERQGRDTGLGRLPAVRTPDPHARAIILLYAPPLPVGLRGLLRRVDGGDVAGKGVV